MLDPDFGQKTNSGGVKLVLHNCIIYFVK